MTAKQRSVYTCQQCGYSVPRWLGRCPECGNWNSFVEEVVIRESSGSRGKKSSFVPQPLPITEVKPAVEMRLGTGIGELDRVLGGGLVPGGVFLVGGAPGIGKSTLLLQAGEALARQGRTVLYISGEESLSQIKMRADRLGLSSDNFLLLAETDVEAILNCLKETKPQVAVVDSVQTIFSPLLESLPGNVSQVRQSGHSLTLAAKESSIAMFLVGHLTKDGNIAGPRVLEHLVDGLLMLEGDDQHLYRLLRAVKNRFGSTNEVGIFEMSDRGIIEVSNPSRYLIGENREGVSGTAITVSLEGSRPLLIEVQALVSSTSYGMPQRTATGIPQRRLAILLAVLEKRLGFKFGTQDVFVNTAGGLQLNEPASDLAVAAALVSSLKDRPLPASMALFGEIGLTGEVRGVSHVHSRVKEASRLGFNTLVLPSANSGSVTPPKDVKITGVRTVGEVVQSLFPSSGNIGD